MRGCSSGKVAEVPIQIFCFAGCSPGYIIFDRAPPDLSVGLLYKNHIPLLNQPVPHPGAENSQCSSIVQWFCHDTESCRKILPSWPLYWLLSCPCDSLFLFLSLGYQLFLSGFPKRVCCHLNEQYHLSDRDIMFAHIFFLFPDRKNILLYSLQKNPSLRQEISLRILKNIL